MKLNYLRQYRSVTDEVRQTILEDLPELADIRDADLRARCIEAWAYSLTHSSFVRIRELPPEGNPGQSVLISGSQTEHLRGVTRLAVKIAEEFIENRPEVVINRDIVLAGGLCHDVGKPYEFDPENRARWTKDPSVSGLPSLRHSVFGAHVCLAVGLPEEVAHIALGHSMEGPFIGLSTECMIVRQADHLWWTIAGALGLLKPESIAHMGTMLRPRRPNARQ
jgi:putative nucleotidyltransferase with HDIG domain